MLAGCSPGPATRRPRRVLSHPRHRKADVPPDRSARDKDGVQITFTTQSTVPPLQTSHYSVKTWSLKRTANYGSEHYDEKPLTVTAAYFIA